MAAVGHHSYAVRRAVSSSAAQQTVTCAYFGRSPVARPEPAPACSNVCTTSRMGAVLMSPSPMRAASSADSGPDAATQIGGGVSGRL